MNAPLPVIFFWHMHQPMYVEPESGRSAMPWVRLHAIKDYYDMARIVHEIPGARAVINMVPSLWLQLDKISKGEWIDLHEEISRKPVDSLEDEERLFVASDFFHCTYDSMIAPYPEYLDLYRRFGPEADPKTILTAGNNTIRDIEVWFHLAWCGNSLKRTDMVSRLLEKGKNFSEEEKTGLLDLLRDFVGKIPAFYRMLVEAGSIEVSTTPYTHPILPLLIDPDSASMACPGMNLPEKRFALVEDAKEHIRRGIEIHRKFIGKDPVGFWPAEGSVSTEAAHAFSDEGVRWIATDEDVLRLSFDGSPLSPDKKYRMYSVCGTNIFFRDHDLSDRIGFHYQRKKSEEAVKDFIARLVEIRDDLPEGKFVVPVILDGENCWEFYEEQGEPFLSKLYSELASDGRFMLTTCEKVLQSHEANAPKLDKLHSGSWIYANFTTWVGDPVKNRAWRYLYEARQAAASILESDEVSKELRAELMEHILAAEGSDWFWWFGEGHSSAFDRLFDELFRKRLSAIYRCIGSPAPEYLNEPVDDRWEISREYSMPTSTIAPTINGMIGSYYEWLNAGVAYPQAGSMQRIQTNMLKLWFGFDSEHLYLRIDGNLINGHNDEVRKVRLVFTSPTRLNIDFFLHENRGENPDGVRYAISRTLEASVPFRLMKKNMEKGEEIVFYVALVEDGIEIERLPQGSPIELPYPADTFDDENWYI